MKKSRLVTFIGGFYIFGGIIVFLSLVFGGSPLNIVFDVSDISDKLVKLIISLIYIPLGCLYIQRKPLGKWLVLILAIIFFCISADLTNKYGEQPYIGNMLYSLFVITVTIWKRSEFNKTIQQ